MLEVKGNTLLVKTDNSYKMIANINFANIFFKRYQMPLLNSCS